jgi:thioredoxin 2
MTSQTAAAPRATVPCQFCGTLNRIDLSRVADRPRCGNAECAKPILLDRPIQLHDADFAKAVAGSEVPLLVDFYADWCGPCKMMAPVLDELAKELAGKVVVAKLDTDRQQATAMAYNIRSIPTLMVFADGKVAATQMGFVPKAQVLQLLRQAGAAV